MRSVVSTAAMLAMVLGCGDQPRQEPSIADVSLAELCKTFNTDKCPVYRDGDSPPKAGHNYIESYEIFFEPLRHRVKRLFEIGVWKGESMRLWETYFPNAHIFGIDIVDTSEYDTDRITTFVADQADRKQLGKFLQAHGGDFDIVIDDGGHSMKQQQVSFGFLFPAVRPGGYYIVEDVHTSFVDGFGAEEDGENSTSNMIIRYIRTGKFESPYLTPDEEQYLVQNVDHCFYAFAANAYRSQFLICKKRM